MFDGVYNYFSKILNGIACCGGRKPDPLYPGNPPVHRGSSDGLDDVTRFDRAYYTADVEALVALGSSTQVIDTGNTFFHPWAADPRTVGAISLVQLGLLAQGAPSVQTRLRQCGALSMMLAELKSTSPDKVHYSLIALQSATQDCPASSEEVVKSGGLTPIIHLTFKSPMGLRATAMGTCRNLIASGGREAGREFLARGGLDPLVAVLKLPESSGDADVVFAKEECLRILGLLLAMPPTFREGLAQSTAVKEELVTLRKKTRNSEVAEACKELLGTLEGLSGSQRRS
eukprot:GHVU01045533.1.p1 GENE.GHVU01045533.1~~GHVU01045533.1.p1  ORF type:complete len:287 (-),score=45.27 GHVU01045533.1:220-1080(-)